MRERVVKKVEREREREGGGLSIWNKSVRGILAELKYGIVEEVFMAGSLLGNTYLNV